MYAQKCQNKAEPKGMVQQTQIITIWINFKHTDNLMLTKRYESTEVNRRTWLHVPSGTPWSTSSDTHHVVEIQKETSTQMFTPFDIGYN